MVKKSKFALIFEPIESIKNGSHRRLHFIALTNKAVFSFLSVIDTDIQAWSVSPGWTISLRFPLQHLCLWSLANGRCIFTSLCFYNYFHIFWYIVFLLKCFDILYMFWSMMLYIAIAYWPTECIKLVMQRANHDKDGNLLLHAYRHILCNFCALLCELVECALLALIPCIDF